MAIFYRTNFFGHSKHWALVRSVAWNISFGTNSVGPRIYPTFLKLSDCFIEFGSKSAGDGEFTDTKGSNDAKYYTAEASEMVYDRCIELLCAITRSQSRWRYNVREFFDKFQILNTKKNLFSRAQQAFDTLKKMFGDNKCFLVQINSQQEPAPSDSIDPWLKFLRRPTKTVNNILQHICIFL